MAPSKKRVSVLVRSEDVILQGGSMFDPLKYRIDVRIVVVTNMRKAKLTCPHRIIYVYVSIGCNILNQVAFNELYLEMC